MARQARDGPLRALASFLLATMGWYAMFSHVKWRCPGGSRFPLGLAAALLLVSASLVLAVLTLRQREGAVTVVVCFLASAIALGCLAYAVAVTIAVHP